MIGLVSWWGSRLQNKLKSFVADLLRIKLARWWVYAGVLMDFGGVYNSRLFTKQTISKHFYSLIILYLTQQSFSSLQMKIDKQIQII